MGGCRSYPKSVAKGRSTVQGGDPETQSVSRFMPRAERDNVLPHRSASRPPEAVAAEASAEVERLLGAIAALGECNPHSTPLKEALRIARAKSKVLPVSERIEACKSFIERARKCLVWTEAVIAKAQEQKAIFDLELQDGEARLAQLQSLSEAQREQPAFPSVIKLQRRIDQLVQECEALKGNPTRKEFPGVWTDGAPPNLQEVPPIPGDRQDLEAWLSCRNCELRNALEFGDAATMARVGGLVAQGSAKMATFAQDVPMQGKSSHDGSSDRSSRRQEEVHRSHTVGWESGVRNSRHGLRGVRVGEASHPGPHGRRTRDVSDTVLDNLERELRLIESDDEPLVRSTSGRNVVPRISSGEAIGESLATVPASPVALETAGRSCAEVVTIFDEGVPSTVPAQIIPTWVDRDDECSVSSESCWGEQEDLIGEEILEWGVLPGPEVDTVLDEDGSITPVNHSESLHQRWSPGEKCWSHNPQEGHPIQCRICTELSAFATT